MGFHIIKPPSKLADYIRCFWVLDSDVPYQHYAVADGLAEMVFHYRGSFQEIKNGKEESSWLSGVQAQSQRARQFVTRTGFGIFGVYLYPFALSKIFSRPADAFSNEMPDLHCLLGKEGDILEEKIMLARDHHERVQIVSAFIEDRITRNYTPLDKITAAVRHVLDQDGQVSIRKVAEEFGLSVRQFERSFKKSAGFNPKLYSRIVRFSSAIKVYKEQSTTLTTVAHACGYYDQSHFIEDFRMFSGVSPKAYFNVLRA
jgi:AraC-like DNA-binding protein